MKSPVKTLKNAFYTLLNGNVTYTNSKGNTSNVPIFKHTPKNTESGAAAGKLFYYVEIAEITDIETANSSDTYTHDCSVNLDVVVGFPGFGSSDIYHDIVDQVTQAINTTKGDTLNLGANFKCLYLYLENTIHNEAEGTHKIITEQLRYRMEVDEI